MAEQLSYAGLLDDVIQRFDPIAKTFSDDFFTRQLIKSALFGNPLIVNDGYLFANDGFDHLADENSLLWSLIRSGFVQVISKSGELDVDAFVRTPEKMAARGMTSNKDTLERPDYLKKIKKIEDNCQFFKRGGLKSFPPYRMDSGFRKLFGNLKGKSVEDLGLAGFSQVSFEEIHERITSHEKYSEFPRQTIEDVLIERERAGQISSNMAVQSLMSIACQAYHYNFSLCLTQSLDIMVGAETTIGKSFEDLLDFDEYFEVDPMRAGMTPLIGIPASFPRDRLDVFADFTQPGRKIYRQKWDFLTQVKEAISAQGGASEDHRQKELLVSFSEYSIAIAEHFNSNGLRGVELLGPGERFLTKLASGLVSFGVGLVGGTSWAAFTSLSPSLKQILPQGGAYKSVAANVSSITRRGNSELIKRSLRPEHFSRYHNGKIFYLEEVSAAHSSVGFTKDAAKVHTSDLPRYND